MTDHFVRGLTDGALSTLGVVIGASSGNVSLVIAAGAGGAISAAVSNMLGAYTASRASRYKEMNEIERAMGHRSLRKSALEKRLKRETTKEGVLDGAATALGGMVPIVPYAFGMGEPLLASVGLTLATLFLLGVHLGKISKESLAFSGVKLVVFGVVTSVMVFLLQSAIIP